MISDADTFWRHILGRVRPGRRNDVLSAAEAEQRMAAAEEDAFSAERVERIVRSATGAAASRPQVVAGRVHRFPMARPALRWAVAATVALAPLAAVAFYKMYDVAPAPPVSASWDYPTAVRLLLDPDTDVGTRREAQGTVAAFVLGAGIETAQGLRSDPGVVGTSAQEALETWRAALTNPEPMAIGSVASVRDIALRLRDPQDSESEKIKLLAILTDDIRDGIAALKVPAPEGEDGFARDQKVYLEEYLGIPLAQ